MKRFTRLAKKIQEEVPGTLEVLYGKLVARKFRRRYGQNQVEAIINNYLADPTNSDYVAEFKAMQEYRKQCKVEAKAELEI